MTWKKLGSKIAYQNPFFSVEESEVLRPDGSESIYYTIKSRKGVGVVAYNGNKVLMVSQYRVPLGRRVWSFVAGGAEGDNLLEEAKRELKEETGYSANKWTILGNFPASPSMNDQVSNLYLAEDLHDGDHQREAGEQDMETKFFSLDEIEQLIANNELSAFDIADFYLFRLYLDKNK